MMNNNLPKFIIGLVLLVSVFAFPRARAIAAPSIHFDPTSATVPQNTEVQITVKVDTETNQVMGADAIVSYAGDDLEVISVTNGNFFPEFNYANNPSGSLEIHGYLSSTYESRTGAGNLAIIRFKAKKGSGSSAVTFACSGSGNDTFILTTTGENVLSCSQTNQAGLTYTGEATATETPTPTQIAGTTATPTPTQVAGQNTLPVCTSLVSSVASAVGAPLPVTFTCTGVDSDGRIAAAEFIFGDGTSSVVTKDVGGLGAIAITHTYTTIGTLGASCRIRDNNNTYSTPNEACKTIVAIKPKPKTTVAPTRRLASAASPTPPVVAIISATPEPTIAPTEEFPQGEAETSEEPASSRFWWIVGGALAIGLGFVLLRKRKSPPGQPLPPMNPPTTVVPPQPPGV